MDDPVVLGGVARPMHVDAVRARIRLELLQILVEMGERVLLDRRSERAQLLPFGNAVHLAVALLPQIPQSLVMHLLVLGRGDEARGGLRLVDRPIAVDLGAARLRLGLRAQRFRRPLGVIEAAAVADDGIGVVPSQQLGMQHRAEACCSCAGSVQDLGDMDELDRHADALGAALLVHQARGVGRDDVFGAGLRVVADLVVAHLGRDDLLEHRERAAEAAAFVRPRRRDELDPLDLREQIHRLRKERLVQFGGRAHA